MEEKEPMTQYELEQLAKKKLIKKIVMYVGIFIAVLILNPIVLVGAGKRGVVINGGGAVSDNIMQEGINWKIPIYQRVVKMDIRIQKEEKGASASSKDLQIVTSKIAINYHLQANNVNKLYQEVGKDYSNVIISPAIQEFVKKTTALYTAEELITKRNEVKEVLRDVITTNVDKNGIIVDDIFIIDFDFSDTFNLAIEAKVTAEQSALEAKNMLEEVKYQAEQKIATATAEAEAIRIQANAINSQGGEDYVNLKAIEQWDGKLPTQFVPGSAIPFINLKQ